LRDAYADSAIGFGFDPLMGSGVFEICGIVHGLMSSRILN
jgi:hypothetical protein